MYRLVVASASSSCLSSFIASPPSISSATASSRKADTAESMARPRFRGLYTTFLLLLALLGATTSHGKVFEFICQNLGKENTCEVHRCAPGETPQHKPHSRPSYNGCGTHELKVNLATTDFTDCCNMHDLAYGSCGLKGGKRQADDMFLICMTQQCDASHHAESKAHKRCLREANLYYNAVYGFGCHFYKRAQRQHCECRPAGSPATYFDAHDHDLQASLRAMWERAAPLNRTGAYKPKWEEFL